MAYLQSAPAPCGNIAPVKQPQMLKTITPGGGGVTTRPDHGEQWPRLAVYGSKV